VIGSSVVDPGEATVGTGYDGVLTPKGDGWYSGPMTTPATDAWKHDLEQARAERRAARERVYYDEEADRRAAEQYYADVPLDQYAALVTSTHARKPNYRPAVELYPWVDLQPDGTIRSLYTGDAWDPDELIAKDLEVQRSRAESKQRMLLDTRANPSGVDAMIEAVLPYNCEHVVPQSWFERAEPMRGDLHHLFACQTRCNSFRGNTPYEEFAGYPHRGPAGAPALGPDLSPTPPGSLTLRVISDQCGRRETSGFEPAHGKGAAARALFYFLLRYTGLADEFPSPRAAPLLTWHEEDPVTEWERHRNAAIHVRQGNRNPFVDHPTRAAEILPMLEAA